MSEQAFVVEYNSNNSGGGWWLDDDDWRKLEVAGWTVEWGGLDFCNSKFGPWGDAPKVAPDTHTEGECPGHRCFESYEAAKASGYRWLGSLARSAKVEVTALNKDFAEEAARLLWTEDINFKYDGSEEGCNCCGRPHSFYATPAEAARSGAQTPTPGASTTTPVVAVRRSPSSQLPAGFTE